MTFGSYGYGGLDEEEKRIQERRLKNASRFWLTTEKDREIILLDDLPFRLREHEIQLDKTSWDKTFLTCRRGFQDDPLCYSCQQGYKEHLLGLITILDMNEWTGRDGKVHQFARRLYPMKLGTMKRFAKRKERVGSLVGHRFLVGRSGNLSPRVGDEFEFIKQEKLADFEVNGKTIQVLADEMFWWTDKQGKKHPPLPFKYEDVVAAKSNEEMKMILSGGGTGSSQTKSPDEEEVPF
jgi:hypothetical protein